MEQEIAVESMLLNQEVLVVLLLTVYIKITNVYDCKWAMKQHGAVFPFTSEE